MRGASIFLDLGFFCARWLLVAIPALPAVAAMGALYDAAGVVSLLGLPLAVLIFLLGLCALVRLGRACLPPLEPGRWEMARDGVAYQRAARRFRAHSVIQATVVALGLVRWLVIFPALHRLYLRAAGAHLHAATLAPGVRLSLPSLVTLEDGVYVGEQSYLAAIMQSSPGRLRIGSIYLGAGTFVGYGSLLGPDTHIGAFCLLGARCLLADSVRIGSHTTVRGGLEADHRVEIGGGSRLGHRVALHAGVLIGLRCRVGSNVVIGRNTRIEDDARIGDDVVIGAGAVVAPGARVPVGARVPPGARFGAGATDLDAG